jgi:hypothetical protein
MKKRKTNFRFSNNVHIWVMCSIRIQDLDQHQNGKLDADPDPQSSYMYVHYSIIFRFARRIGQSLCILRGTICYFPVTDSNSIRYMLPL